MKREDADLGAESLPAARSAPVLVHRFAPGARAHQCGSRGQVRRLQRAADAGSCLVWRQKKSARGETVWKLRGNEAVAE